MVADGRTKKVRPLLDRGGLIHPRCHPDLSLILRVTARPAAAYLPMTRGVQPRGSGAMFPRVPGRIPPSAALLTHPARYSFHQSHCSYYTQRGQGLSRENAARPPLFLWRKKTARWPLTDIIISIHWFQSFAVGRLKSKADDMRVSLRAILLSTIASLHERTAGRAACSPTSE